MLAGLEKSVFEVLLSALENQLLWPVRNTQLCQPQN